MQTNKIFSLIAAAALAISVSAQQSVHDNYVGVSFGGGLNSMLYKPANGQQGLGFGFDAGLFYGHFFNQTVGLGFGVQYSWANAYATYNWNEVTNGLTHPDNPNTPYNLTTGFNNFKERQNVGYISIPVEVLFRKPLNDRAAFIAGVGVALDLPIHGKYIAKSGSYSTTGVFPEAGSYVFENMPEHGFSTYTTTQNAKINNRAKVGGSVIADLGFRVALSDMCGMYFGVYAGYGFTNLLASAKTDEMIMINATNPAIIDYRGTFDSNETGKVNLIRCGLKVAVDFGWPSAKDKAEKAEAERLAQEEADRLAAELAAAAERARQDSIAAAEEAERLAREAEEAELARIAAEQAQLDSVAAAERARQDSIAAAEELLRQRIAHINALKAAGESVTVHFETGGADLKFKAEEQPIIDEICAVMAEDKSMRIVITGHTDNTGNAQQNLNVWGKKRAEALKAYMVKQGVAADQIKCESKGQLEPVGDNNTPEGRALNRRANIRFE